MDLAVEEGDYWWFVELYATLGAFADKPANTISRIGGGRVSIPEDQANHFANFRRCILAKYPTVEDLQVMRVAAEIDAILTRRAAAANRSRKSSGRIRGLSAIPIGPKSDRSHEHFWRAEGNESALPNRTSDL